MIKILIIFNDFLKSAIVLFCYLFYKSINTLIRNNLLVLTILLLSSLVTILVWGYLVQLVNLFVIMNDF